MNKFLLGSDIAQIKISNRDKFVNNSDETSDLIEVNFGGDGDYSVCIEIDKPIQSQNLLDYKLATSDSEP